MEELYKIFCVSLAYIQANQIGVIIIGLVTVFFNYKSKKVLSKNQIIKDVLISAMHQGLYKDTDVLECTINALNKN